jgi:hypothetical protein
MRGRGLLATAHHAASPGEEDEADVGGTSEAPRSSAEDELLERARKENAQHWREFGRHISAETLRKRLQVGAARSRMLVSMMRTDSRYCAVAGGTGRKRWRLTVNQCADRRMPTIGAAHAAVHVQSLFPTAVRNRPSSGSGPVRVFGVLELTPCFGCLGFVLCEPVRVSQPPEGLCAQGQLEGQSRLDHDVVGGLGVVQLIGSQQESLSGRGEPFVGFAFAPASAGVAGQEPQQPRMWNIHAGPCRVPVSRQG